MVRCQNDHIDMAVSKPSLVRSCGGTPRIEGVSAGELDDGVHSFLGLAATRCADVCLCKDLKFVMTRYVDPTDQLVTEIFTRDIGRSVAFYRKLGFELLRDDGGFVELGWEGHCLFLSDELKEKMTADSGLPQGNIRVMVPNVDDFWALSQELGAPVLSPITDQSYGLRDFTIADPDGFGVRFATQLRDLTE